VLVRMAPVARKQSAIEERSQGQGCFEEQITKQRPQPWDRVPMKMVSAAVITLYNTVNTNVLGFRDCVLL
jgi:hypothetical protein